MTLRERWPAVLLIAATLIYCAPLFTNLGNWGRQDWDQFTFRYATPRLALLRDHALPAWNPYANGGTVLLAHPDSPVLSPWYAIVLVLGAPLGLRVQVAVFMALGSIGMSALLARLGATRAGAIAGGVVFMMSSLFALHIAEGHLEWCVLGLMPWLAILILKLEDGVRYIILAALLAASVLTFGAVCIPAIFLSFFTVWILLEAIRTRRWRPTAYWTAVVLLAALLSASGAASDARSSELPARCRTRQPVVHARAAAADRAAGSASSDACTRLTVTRRSKTGTSGRRSPARNRSR